MSAESPVRTVCRWLCLGALAGLASCSADTDGAPSGDTVVRGRWIAPVEDRARDAFPREFTNAKGERFVIPGPPQRIASATLPTDVVLWAICPKDRIAALHEVSTKPLFSPIAAESRAFPRHVTPDPETVLAARPDLVFLASFSDRRFERLVSREGRTVIRLHRFSSIRGAQEMIRAVGYIIGEDRAAESLVAQMQARLDAVAARRSERAPWRLLSWSDGFVAGKGTIFDDIVACVGARNLAAEDGIEGARHVESERFLALQPDALVVGVLPGTEDDARRRLRSITALRHLKAVRRDRIVFVPNHLLLSTTHHLAGAAEVMAATLDRWGKP